MLRCAPDCSWRSLLHSTPPTPGREQSWMFCSDYRQFSFMSAHSLTDFCSSPSISYPMARCQRGLNKFPVCWAIEMNEWVRSFGDIAVVEKMPTVDVQTMSVLSGTLATVHLRLLN